MKRSLLIFLAGLLILCPVLALAVDGTVVQTSKRITVSGIVQRAVVTLTCTGSSSDGSFPVTGGAVINPTTLNIEGWYLESVETDPGSTAPTTLYDIVINDARGYDVAGGLLADRSATVTQKVYLASVGQPIIDGNWIWTMTNNAVHSAGLVAKLTFIAN